MQRKKQFAHHFGQRGRFGSAGRIRVALRARIKSEWFMTPLMMRRHWGNVGNALYGPLNTITAYLRWRGMDRKAVVALAVERKADRPAGAGRGQLLPVIPQADRRVGRVERRDFFGRRALKSA